MSDGGEPQDGRQEQPTQPGRPPERPPPRPAHNEVPASPQANLRPVVPPDHSTTDKLSPEQTQVYRPNRSENPNLRLPLDKTAEQNIQASSQPETPRGFEPQALPTEAMPPEANRPSSAPNASHEAPSAEPTPPMPAPPPTFGSFEETPGGNTTQVGGPPETPAPLRGPKPGPTPTPPPGPPSLPDPASDFPSPNQGQQFVPPSAPQPVAPPENQPTLHHGQSGQPNPPMPPVQLPPQPATPSIPPAQQAVGNQPVDLGQTPAPASSVGPASSSSAGGSLMMPLAALAGSLVVVSFGGLASYFDISRGYGDASLFFRQVGGVWPALLVAAVVALALATSTISTRARTAMIAAAVLTAIPTGIGYLVFVWSRLFGDSGQFRQIFQDLVGPTGQALLLCVAAGVAAIMAISNRDKALSIITLGLVGAPALGILSSRRLWGSLPPIGLMDQLAVLLSGFSSALAAGLLFASVANALRPTNSQIRLGIAIAAGVTLGAVLLRSLAGAIGDGEARFAGFFPADSHITLVLCAVALILSLLSLKPQTKAA